MDMNTIPGIEKLADFVLSYFVGPKFASWKARREAEAKQIEARGEAEKQIILAEGQAKSLQIIAEAQRNMRSMLTSTNSMFQAEPNTETINQTFQFEQEKRWRNISSVVKQATQEVVEKSVPDVEPDHDWTARFFNEVQDVSSEEMQSLWAKILAGEIERSGNTSLQTLSILRNLDRATAISFRRLCSVCVSIAPDGNEIWDARAPSLGGYPEQNALREYGLSFDTLNVLNEHGLIISDYNSWHDYSNSIGKSVPEFNPKKIYVPIYFQGQYWILLQTSERPINQELRLSGVALTRSGRELSRVVDIEPMTEYTQKLMNFFETEKLQMIQVDSGQPQIR